MKGIKENNKITKVLQAAQITNESRHLKMTFTKMVSLYGQQIEQSYTVERHFATLVSSIAGRPFEWENIATFYITKGDY